MVRFGRLIDGEFKDTTNAQGFAILLHYWDNGRCPVCKLYGGDDVLPFQMLQLLINLSFKALGTGLPLQKRGCVLSSTMIFAS